MVASAVNNKNIDVVRRMTETDTHVSYHEIRASLGIVYASDNEFAPLDTLSKTAPSPTPLAALRNLWMTSNRAGD
ncbi:hypothetical protein EVAR_48780_1 [Eumeta japonica]|uniref:Uncharacterized protein n=1 Tax=Eumeta variegata TaxID=151549 RepID=A0A4C1Y337_EUMVA|nr:hypothetical protein EVAR_48780_1 [Eumeta japonica]